MLSETAIAILTGLVVTVGGGVILTVINRTIFKDRSLVRKNNLNEKIKKKVVDYYNTTDSKFKTARELYSELEIKKVNEFEFLKLLEQLAMEGYIRSIRADGVKPLDEPWISQIR